MNREAPDSSTRQKNWRHFFRTTIGLALTLAVLVLPLYAYKVYLKTDYTDFDVYYKAASRVKAEAWNQIYNLGDGASPYRYAPVILPLFRPFAELTPVAAKLSWYFLQYLWFSLGFYFLYRTLRITQRAERARGEKLHALGVTAFSVLFILRFCLDTFTIGQVSSLLFFGLCAGLYCWMLGRPAAAGALLFIPALFKIGPGYLYGLFLSSHRRDRFRAWLMPVLGLAALAGTLGIWARNWQRSLQLWSDWVAIVAADSRYYDASHYGNQSIKGALLRLAKAHWVESTVGAGWVTPVMLFLLVTGCSAVLLFWSSRRPRTPLGRGFFFSLGLFPYVWFMPETFKYSMTVLAIPAAFLLASLACRPPVSRSRLTVVALVFGLLTLSLPGKDLVGDLIFFGLQKQSVPLVATLVLFAAVVLEAWRESIPSRFGATLSALFFPTGMGPWQASLARGEQATEHPAGASFLLPLPLDSHGEANPRTLCQTLSRALECFRASFDNGSFEILVVPFGNRVSEFHPDLVEVRRLAALFPEIRVVFIQLPAPASRALAETRGAALREAFLNSHGRHLFLLNAELPCDPEFYLEASRALHQGFDLVRGNRRLPQTRFKIPVRFLSMVYGRHRLGLLFNRLVRSILPVSTTDTHSGILAMTRSLALNAFSLQCRADFLFDLELAVIARTHSARELDLPMRIFLSQEKTASRLSYETLSILLGLPSLAKRVRQGFYDSEDRLPAHWKANRLITADDWGMSPGVNEGILALARKGVVKRISAMANCAYLTHRLTELLAIPGIEIGLHFDLTHGKSSPSKILLEALQNRFFSRQARDRFESGIRTEFEQQLARLKAAGIDPVYLDGHHHIHLVPGVLQAVAEPLRRAGIRQVRLPYDPALWFTPKFPLLALSLLAAQELKKLQVRSLPCFYPEQKHFQDPALMRAALLKRTKTGATEVIVHPAAVDDLGKLEIPDSYTTGRVREFHALMMLAD